MSGWATDGKFHYWGSRRLEDCDYINLTILNEMYAKDTRHVYYAGEAISGADAETFEVIGPGVILGQDASWKYDKGRRSGKLSDSPSSK